MHFTNKVLLNLVYFGIVYFFSTSAQAITKHHWTTASSTCQPGGPGTKNQPWCGLKEANQRAQAGDIVILKRGVYTESISPKRNGKKNRPIKYLGSGSLGDVVVRTRESMSGVHLSRKSFIHIENIKFDQVKGNWVYMDRSSFCTIKNNKMVRRGIAWAGLRLSQSNSNSIIGNNIRSSGKRAYVGDAIYLTNGSNKNLISGNIITDAAHNTINLNGKIKPLYNNIIRNNTLTNRWHTVISVWNGVNNTLIEGNRIYEAGRGFLNNPLYHYPKSDYLNHSGIQLGSKNCIIRRNIFYRNAIAISHTTYSSATESSYNRIYHNTIYQSLLGLKRHKFAPKKGFFSKGNVYKNNIFYDGKIGDVMAQLDKESQKNKYISNNFTKGEIQSWPTTAFRNRLYVSELESLYPQVWQHNQESYPNFTNVSKPSNPSKPHLTLGFGSPLIDAGEWLTQTRGSGSSRYMAVDDVKYFAKGDKIYLQGKPGNPATITNIDYSKQFLTLNRAITWRKGDGISFKYGGRAPDIGANERL